MPNTYIKPTVIARAALGLLEAQLVLGRLVYRDYERDFAGKIGDTVNVRVPGAAVAARRFDRTGVATGSDTTVQLSSVSETSFPVQLTHHLYNAVAVTDEERTFLLDDYGSRILEPQVRGIAEGVEGLVSSVLDARTATVTVNATTPENSLTEVAVLMDQRKIPRTGRTLVISPDMQTYFLNSDRLVRVDASGSDSALRDAEIGRLRGFNIVVSSQLKAGSAHALTADAIALVTKAPAAPAGATNVANESYGGYAMRYLFDYDASVLQDRGIASIFAGIKVTDTNRIVSIKAPTV
jgi:hypothetical protein